MKNLTKITAILIMGLLMTYPISAFAKKGKVRTEIESISAIQKIIFKTGAGKITVYLPEDILAGDMISGTISTQPAGTSSEDKQANADSLNKYSVEINNEIISVGNVELKFSIPKSSTGGVTYMILRDSNGEEWARNYITYQNTTVDIKNFTAVSPWEFQSPKIGRSANPSVIKGPFDGNFGTTSIMVGNKTVKKIAESPRAFIFENPKSPIGNMDLLLNERGVGVKRKYSNIRVVKVDENQSDDIFDLNSEDNADNNIIANSDQQRPGDTDNTKLSATDMEAATNKTEVIVSENKYGLLKESELPVHKEADVNTAVTSELNAKDSSTSKPQELSKSYKTNTTDDVNSFAAQSVLNNGDYTVQIASYKHQKDAVKLADKLKSKGYKVFITKAQIPSKGTWYRVRVGMYQTKNEADKYGVQLTRNEPLVKSMFVTRAN